MKSSCNMTEQSSCNMINEVTIKIYTCAILVCHQARVSSDSELLHVLFKDSIPL